MANIFSGIFSYGANRGSDAAKLARYKQELEEYAQQKEAYDQAQAVSAIDPYLKEVLQYMTPERQAHVRLERAMMQQPPLFEKGIEGFNTSKKQRGTTIADIIKQAEELRVANAKHQYKVDNPLPSSEASKIEVAKSYVGQEEWDRLQQSNDPRDREILQGLMRDAWRDRQFVDTATGHQNVYSQQFIAKQLIQAGVDKDRAPIITQRLTDFYDDVDDTENFLIELTNRRQDIQRLHGDTDFSTTGLSAIMSFIPLTDASRWMHLRDTVVSNVGLGKILELKASSAQGATGLGALNQQELHMLQTHIGNLMQTNHPEDIRKHLRRLDNDLDKMIERRMRKLKQQRRWYNRNKKYLRIDPKAPDLIPPEQEYLFGPKPFKKRENTSPLPAEGEGNKEQLKAIADEYGLELPDER